ncbi:MAG: Rpn family recombination-promoting nuclease/putative transposase [Prevotella sp.]|nr:Rpn family recombination-promoting nuclease/putative transposase [Prevotella sp.]MBP3828235.1 Rpn family recombination-promoting nuclease/putative transposase [Prevotella sp.]
MGRYLDPKADITFKKVFGEHPDLLMSLLNALLPLEPGQEIVDLEYLPADLIPETPLTKYSIVDVRCRDRVGRQFIVEMQMEFNSEFTRRVLYNTSKAFVKQLDKGMHYDSIQPVYSLNLVNDIYVKDEEDYYHHYQMAEKNHPDHIIEGMHILFFELPKFKPQTITEKKMEVLWLRFLTEIDEKTKRAPAELLENAELNKALEIVEEAAYSEAEMNSYDKFWDAVSWENTMENKIKRREEQALKEGEARGLSKGEAIGLEKGEAIGLEKGEAIGLEKGEAIGLEKGEAIGLEKGEAIGLEKGEAIGLEKGMTKGIHTVAKNMKKKGIDPTIIAEATGLSLSEIEEL